MRRGNRHRLTQPQGKKIAAEAIVIEALRLIDHRGDRLTGAPQQATDFFVSGRQAVACIQDQEQVIRLFDRALDLALHQGVDAQLITADSAGVNHHIRLRPKPANAVLAVAGKSRAVRNQRVARSSQPIEQCGLTDVGTTDQRNDR